jgi:hypothetical protein
MGSGGSGAGAGGGGYSGGGLANTGGSGYGGDLGGYGTAGEMSGGAGGNAMGGFGNTGAGGSGMSGVSTMSGMTPPGFTPAYGDPRGTSIGMDAFGNYKGTPGYAGIGAPGKPTTMSPKAQIEMFGYVKYPSSVVPQTFSQALPTQTQALSMMVPGAVPGYVNTPPAQFNSSTIGPNTPRGIPGLGPQMTGGMGGGFAPGAGPDPSIGNRGTGFGGLSAGEGRGVGLGAGPGGPLGFGGTRRM